MAFRINGSLCDSVDRTADSIPVLRISNVTKITSKFCFNPVSEEFVTDIVNDLSWNTYWWKTPTENLERM